MLNILRTGWYLTARYFSIVYKCCQCTWNSCFWLNCKDFIDKLVGMNVDVASMNLGIYKAMGIFLKEKAVRYK